MRLRVLFVFCLAMCVCLGAASASAQPSESDAERAKELFERGKRAMSVGRFAEAQEAFSQSLALVPKASAAFNLAVAFRGMGRPKEASEVLTSLVAGGYGQAPPEMREQAEVLEKEARHDIATLRITQKGAVRAEVRVDGSPVGSAVEGQSLTLRVNPGARLISVSAPMREHRELTVPVAAGQTKSLTVALVLSRAARMSTLELLGKAPDSVVEIVGVRRARGRIVQKLDPGKYRVRLQSSAGNRESEIELRPATRHRMELEPERSGLFESPWFWATAGTVAVGATVGGYFLFRERQAEPVRDPEFNVVQTLRSANW